MLTPSWSGHQGVEALPIHRLNSKRPSYFLVSRVPERTSDRLVQSCALPCVQIGASAYRSHIRDFAIWHASRLRFVGARSAMDSLRLKTGLWSVGHPPEPNQNTPKLSEVFVKMKPDFSRAGATADEQEIPLPTIASCA